jgi:hypothetical protein
MSKMKVDLLASGSPDCPLIRIYGSDLSAVAEFANAIGKLRDGATASVQVAQLTGFDLVNCSLMLVSGSENEGIASATPAFDSSHGSSIGV